MLSPQKYYEYIVVVFYVYPSSLYIERFYNVSRRECWRTSYISFYYYRKWGHYGHSKHKK